MVVTLGEAEEALEEAVLLLLLLAGGLLGVGGRGLLVDLGAGGGDTALHGADAALEAGDDDGDKGGGNGLLKSLGKDLLDGTSDHLRDHVDDGLQNTKLGSHGLDIARNRVDVAAQGGEVGSESANVGTNGIDMLTDGIDMRLLSIGERLLGRGDVVKAIGTETDRASRIKKSMLDHTEDILQDILHVESINTLLTLSSQMANAVMNFLQNCRHVDTSSSRALLSVTTLDGMVDSMLDKAVKVGLAMKTLDHVLNAGADIASLGVLATETITLSDSTGELNKEHSGLAHAVPLRAGGITASLAKTKEASVVIEHGLHVIVRSSGARELSVGAGLGKVTTHGLNHDGAVGTTIDDNSDGGLGRGHVTSTVTLGGGSDRAVSHGAISDRGLDVNARVNREGRGLGRLVLGGGLGVDRKLGLSRSHCFRLVVDV